MKRSLIKHGDHYEMVIRNTDGKVIYNNLCKGKVLKRRKDCDIEFRKFREENKVKKINYI
jgi:hypothetical protein